ncbi:ribonuclease E inhibitor RraB [Hahella aquimaris]|uniref:ribonuclease E inhibitor RraB n=1 Tax=Hahella sp. HNIBRBA332 TaxID=3015983 RepID=UPI00273BAF90|nr:ribonuclease E inhibitor RraB [Hahella sp. HNIBRBA332]WLQ14319.1 ribonuclease E inhibitor RraB [Hahella sp. HNIBRBA332]
MAATLNVLQQLESLGSDLSKPMVIDFFIALRSETDGEKIRSEVESLGFSFSVELDAESKEWTGYCSIKVVPSHEAISMLERKLHDIASKVGGKGDGFGSYGNG